MILLVNLGSTLVYMFILVNLYILYFILFVLAIFIPKLECLVSALHNKLFWSWPLAFLLQQFQPLVMLSIINCYDLRTDTVLHTASAIISVILLGITQLTILFVRSKISRARAAGRIKSDKF